MTTINVKMFGTPIVKKENKQINFPLKKAEALFYYLLINGQTTRDELVALLWADIKEKSAKKNLRNSMYKLRKCFDMDIVISPQRQIVCINPDIKIEADIYNFSNKHNELEAYSGEFLQGFLVRNAAKFEEWMIHKREYYNEVYISTLYQKIEHAKSKRKYDDIEHYCKILINADNFDERPYRILMELYKDNGLYNKAIEVYKKLSEVLDKELGIMPDVETKECYELILNFKNSQTNNSHSYVKDFFYGRVKELNIMHENYYNFINNKKSKSIVIIGEAGIGKTKLNDKFLESLDNDNAYFLETNCYQAEKSYILKPWNNIFSKISNIIIDDNIEIPVLCKNVISHLFPDFAIEYTQVNINPVEKIDALKYQVIENSILKVLKSISKNKKILFVFEDMQWVDSMSLSLLSNILLHDQNKNIFFIGTMRNSYDEDIDKFLINMFKYNLIQKVEVERFNRDEVNEFIEKILPDYLIEETLKEKVYRETEGNTFFLIEILNNIKKNGSIENMSSKMKDILKTRFLDISESGKKMSNIISLFFDEVSLDILTEISGKDEFEVMDIIEELEDKFIIKESNDNINILFKFTHQKLREFIYLNQSPARRRILHNKVGMILESKLKKDKKDSLIYPKLIYHFSNAGNKLMVLKYTIKNANLYLDFTHELFPELKDNNIDNKKYFHITKEKAINYMDDIEKLINEVEQDKRITEEVIKLKLTFCHMKGRYLIREGEYDKGIAYIQKVIKNANRIEDYKYAIKGYRQMIYYCIQTHNMELMKKYLDIAIKTAEDNKYRKEKAILLRLKGLNKIMFRKYKEAEELLKESIKIFTLLNYNEDKYSLNIVAAYNYIGEIRRYNMKFSSALRYYDKAIEICMSKGVLRGLTVFNTNAGQSAFEMGDYDRSKKYFEEAIEGYNKLDSLWGRSTANGFMALLSIKEGNYDGALELLRRADEFASKIKSPYEIGIIYRIKGEIKASMENNQDLRKVFSKYLNLSLNDYCDKGIKILKKVHESYEIDILKALKNK